jgi:3-ketosteroid 9alpha-monooxygenase subunit B
MANQTAGGTDFPITGRPTVDIPNIGRSPSSLAALPSEFVLMSTVDSPRATRAVVLTVTDVVEETADARSLVFAWPEGESGRFCYRPGQFLTLRVPSDTTGSVARCYSLASSPHVDDAPKVTVKRTAGGYGSNWLCDNISAGDRIEVLPPAGTFTPVGFDCDFLLWAGGSGITPVMSILKSALSVGTGRVVLLYANRDERSVIFADELRSLTSEHPDRLTVMHWLESLQGLPNPMQLAALAAPFGDHESFVCGPAAFMQTVHEALAAAGVPRDRVHAEVFRSLSSDPFADPDTAAPLDDALDDAAVVDIELDGQRHRLRWPRRSTLVDVLIGAGIDAPYSCREGQCGSCVCTVVSGDVDMAPSDILEPGDRQAGLILGCQARPASDEVRIDF